MLRELNTNEMETVSGGRGKSGDAKYSVANRGTANAIDAAHDAGSILGGGIQDGINGSVTAQATIGGAAAIEGGIIGGSVSGSRAGPYGALAGGIIGANLGDDVLGAAGYVLGFGISLINSFRDDPVATTIDIGEHVTSPTD